METSKPVDPPEKSLRYIAWSLKEMNESLKQLTMCIQEYVIECRKSGDRLDALTKDATYTKPHQNEIPF